MHDDEWATATTEQKLAWLRAMSLDRLDQTNAIAQRAAALAAQLDQRLTEQRGEILRLREQLSGLQEERRRSES